MIKAFITAAAKVSTMWSLAAFSIAAILYIATRKRQSAPLFAAIGAIVLLGLFPIAGSLYVKAAEQSQIYRVRVTVVGPDGTPRDDARVWSSLGGEPKAVQGGWQFDIPKSAIPTTGALTVFAKLAPEFLFGQETVRLQNDPNPALTIRLTSDASANIRGIVLDKANRLVDGVSVSVAGYPVSIKTGKDGAFVVAAHAAKGQQVLIHAEKPGYAAVNQYHPAGDAPLTIVLSRGH